MPTKRKLWRIAIELLGVGLVTVVLFVLVVNAMRNPVDVSTRSYTAEFTDVSGLRVNGDVRMKGLRIGKVQSVELHQSAKGAAAEVRFSMDRAYQLTDTTQLAIKYQNLTGARYIDVALGQQQGHTVEHMPASATRPSYDITQLFNGLQPVLSTMNTEQVNTFAENAIALLQGDGSGLGPMLDSAQRLAAFAQDRQQVISTLTANVARIADTMGGRSQHVIDFLEAMNLPISNAMTVLDEFPKTAAFGPELVEPIERLLAALGISPDLNIEQLLGEAFGSISEAANSLRLLPNALAGLQISHDRSPETNHCSNGIAALPSDVRVLLNGSEVVLCNAK